MPFGVPKRHCASSTPRNTDACAVKTTFTLSVMGFFELFGAACVHPLSLNIAGPLAGLLPASPPERLLVWGEEPKQYGFTSPSLRCQPAFQSPNCASPFPTHAFATAPPGTVSSRLIPLAARCSEDTAVPTRAWLCRLRPLL